MIFGTDHKVLINSMNDTEAKAFILFLNVEESRHRVAIERSSDNIKNASPNSLVDQALVQFEVSACKRHMDDIEDIRQIRDKVKKIYYW